jgi:hypothetical protein
MIFFTRQEMKALRSEDKRQEQKREANRRYWMRHKEAINQRRRLARQKALAEKAHTDRE